MRDRLAANLSRVQARMAAACARSSRNPDHVRLLAVVKYAEWDWVRALIDSGLHDLGENRPQQLIQRAGQLAAEHPEAGGPSGVRWHLIGHLQRNKVRAVLPQTALIHSVDSLRLLERIGGLAGEQGLRPRVLLEVNVSGEASKDGLAPEVVHREWEQFCTVDNVEIAGLMTMAPECPDPQQARPHFRRLRDLRDQLAARGTFPLPELSMGMSGDFETAIEEGATIIRIGSLLFEGLARRTSSDSAGPSNVDPIS